MASHRGSPGWNLVGAETGDLLAPSVNPLEDQASEQLFSRLQRSMPGGNTRTATFYRPFPLALEHGEGAHVWDADGNLLLDFVNNYTSLVHGHARPEITEAIRREAARGTVFPAPSRLQADLAERICKRVESVELIRFTNSGTEAGMHAVRCARAATGRPLVVKAHNGYHGSWDGLPSSLDDVVGIADPVLKQLRWVDYNSADDLARVMKACGTDVAAIVFEPVLGCAAVLGEAKFLQAARRLADEHGALLILDEVVTMRLDYGGYQRPLDVKPDLTTFGKLIGGGLPVGAFGGSSDLMELYDPRQDGGVQHHGTFNGNSLTMAAGIVSLDLLTEAEIDRINRLGGRLAQGLRLGLDAADLVAAITEAGSLVQVHFDVERPPRCGDDLNPASRKLARFHRAALNRGIYIAPRGELNVSTAMDDEIVDQAIAELVAALADVAAASSTAQ